MSKFNYYVVWVGRTLGVFNTDKERKKSTDGYSNAKHKGFKTREEAERAFNMGYEKYQEWMRNGGDNIDLESLFW